MSLGINFPSRYHRGFTLLELLIVVAIIGILASIGLPAMRGIGDSQTVAAATRQMMDDVARARYLAIANRTTVYLVFVGKDIVDVPTNGLQISELKGMRNLYASQFTGYGIFSKRKVGDQPGSTNFTYFGEWKTLPAGVFIETNKLHHSGNHWDDYANMAFPVDSFPVPTTSSDRFAILPYIAFDGRGQVISSDNKDAFIPLVQGSVSYVRDREKNPMQSYAKAEIRSGSITNGIRIDWLTGRSRLEVPELE
jgi:prepilin-type N-terminal cleavage/methylation domain-containing protein